jgi:HDOD domain
MLVQPLPDLAAWSHDFQNRPIPVLQDTAQDLQLLADIEDRHGTVDAHLIEQAIGDDPLMTLQVLVHLSRHRPGRQITDVHTVTAAVVLMGIGPFFQTFAQPVVLEDHLQAYPQAIEAVHRLLRRTWCGARLVTEFALQHADTHAGALQKAALLHGHARLLLWCHAPALALAVQEQCAWHPQQDAASHELALLHTTLDALEHRLARDWGLPGTLRRLTDPQDSQSQVLLQPQRRLLALALALAERIDCDGPQATLPPAELEELSALLGLSIPSVQRLIDNTLA